MKEKMGFLELISDQNELYSLLSKDERTGQLGFSILNDYFSEKLFPGISTLMPNLVYCYLIFALTWEKESLSDEDLNTMLAEITTCENNGKSMQKANKGFHGDVKENIMGSYRRFMHRYGFFAHGDPAFAALNQKLAGQKRCNQISRYMQLRSQGESGISALKKDALKPKLTPSEQTDMIQRCQIRLGQDRENGMEYSLFDAIIVCISNVKKKDIPKFEDIGQYYTDALFPACTLKTTYEAARFASLMEYYIKCRSNELTRSDKKRMRGESLQIDDEKTNSSKIISQMSGDLTIADSDLEHWLSSIENDGCKNIFEKMITIYNMLEKKDFEEADREIRTLMTEAENGNNREWNRKEITEYIDTFRWEYRPENRDRKAGNNTKCASYYVNELLGGGSSGR